MSAHGLEIGSGTGNSRERLYERVKNLPDRPGVYIMKDAAGRVIYIGKASSLKNRVRSYFQSPEIGRAHV